MAYEGIGFSLLYLGRVRTAWPSCHVPTTSSKQEHCCNVTSDSLMKHIIQICDACSYISMELAGAASIDLVGIK